LQPALFAHFVAAQVSDNAVHSSFEGDPQLRADAKITSQIWGERVVPVG